MDLPLSLCLTMSVPPSSSSTGSTSSTASITQLTPGTSSTSGKLNGYKCVDDDVVCFCLRASFRLDPLGSTPYSRGFTMLHGRCPPPAWLFNWLIRGSDLPSDRYSLSHYSSKAPASPVRPASPHYNITHDCQSAAEVRAYSGELLTGDHVLHCSRPLQLPRGLYRGLLLPFPRFLGMLTRDQWSTQRPVPQADLPSVQPRQLLKLTTICNL